MAVIEKKAAFGGPTGLTSKAVREAAKRIVKAIDQIGGDRRKQVKSLWRRSFPSLKTEAEVLQAVETRARLKKSGCDLFIGSAEFSDKSDVADLVVKVCRPGKSSDLVFKHCIIATGSRPNRPAQLKNGVPLQFTKGKIVCATEMGSLSELPNSIAIVGGGVIAVEYATVLAELGVGVSLLCKDNEFMPFLEEEMRSVLRKRMEMNHILFVENDVKFVEICEGSVISKRHSSVSATGNKSDTKTSFVRVALAPDVNRAKSIQRVLKVDMLFYSGGRDANSDGLGCENAGIAIGRYGRINVNNFYKTNIDGPSSVYAIGDVIGPPGLASTAQQQGRSVAKALFRSTTFEKRETVASSSITPSEDLEDDLDVEVDSFFTTAFQNIATSSTSGSTDSDSLTSEDDVLFGSASGENVLDAPLTLWTLPEMASVGLTKKQAEERGIKTVEGRAYFRDMARGRLSGDKDGFLKIVASIERIEVGSVQNRRRNVILGVHILGEGANELIQLGSILVHSGSTLDAVSLTPFAAVTLSGLYQMACDDALFSISDTAE